MAWCDGEVPSARTLYTHVSYIRNRLGLTPRNALRLRTVYGVGYRLDECIELSANKPVGPSVASLQSFIVSRWAAASPWQCLANCQISEARQHERGFPRVFSRRHSCEYSNPRS